MSAVRSAARERVRQLQEAEERRARRRRSLVVSAGLAVALVLALVVALVVSTSRGGGGDEVAAPAGVTADGGLVAGDPAAPVTVAVYLDYQCPFCQRFEAEAGPWLSEQVAAGSLAVEYHPLALLDRASSGTRYSTRSAGAAYCLTDGGPGADVAAFTADLLARQPPEGGSGLDDAELVAAAERAGGAEAVAGCITAGTFAPYVEQVSEAALRPDDGAAATVRGTPAVFVEGREVPAELAAVQQAVAAAS